MKLAYGIVIALIAAGLTSATAEESPKDDTPEEVVPRFTISTIAGTGERGMSGDGGPATAAVLQRPTSVALDSKGNLYIADEQNRRVRRVTPDGIISTVVGTGKTTWQDKELPATETNLSKAYGIAIDHKDNLYVLSRQHSKIFRVGADGMARWIAGTGKTGFSGDGGKATSAQISFPAHLVADKAGNLFLADTGNNRIRKITPEGVITTIAGTGDLGYGGDGGPATEAVLGAPSAIDLDAEGNLYIADFYNHRVRKIGTDGIIHTIAGTGTSGYNGDGGKATLAQIGDPCGVVVDESGFVYIGDQANLRVRVVTPAGTIHTVAGTGERGLTGDGGPAEQAQISHPHVLALGKDGSLYVPDHLNAVVRKLTPVSK